MELAPEIFRAYDIRGIVDENLTEATVERIGLAYGSLMRSEGVRGIAIGHDVRETSPIFARACAKGVCAAGVDVVMLGTVTTPMLYYSTTQLDIGGGIMITGSHNPIEYNGLKICRGVWPIWGDEIQKLAEMARVVEPATDRQGEIREHDIFPQYRKELVGHFSFPAGTRVAIDCGNGTAGPFIVPILEDLGVEVDGLYIEPDGTFPNHLPDPEVPEYMEALRQHVMKTDSVCGLGFDGDSDRVGVIDESGTKRSADHLLLLMARHLLEKVPGGTVIFDVKCSDFLFEDIAKRGGKPLMWKTGHSIIKEKLRTEGAIIAGELSGHICVAHEYYGFDDAFYAALMLLEINAKHGGKFSELFEDIPKTFYTPEVKIPISEEAKFGVVSELVAHFKNLVGHDRVNDIDGVRATFDDGWALIRASNTTANLTARVEARTEEGLKRIAGILEEALAHHPADTSKLEKWT